MKDQHHQDFLPKPALKHRNKKKTYKSIKIQLLITAAVKENSTFQSGSVTIIGDSWQPFCVGKSNGGHKARPRKTTNARVMLA